MSKHDLEPQLKHQAYKTGYRFGIKGRSLSQIPSQIRGNTQLRSLYEEGWNEAQQEIKAGGQYTKKQYIRHRVSWILMTALAGIISAFLIMQSLSEPTEGLKTTPSENLNAPTSKPEAFQSNWDSADDVSLSLLSDQERQSLSVTQPPRPIIPKQTLENLEPSLKVQLYNGHNPEQHFTAGARLPKYVRELIFRVDTSELSPSIALTVRWLWQRQLIHSQSWPADQSVIQAKQSLFSAQQGHWDIEILDPSGQVIYLYHFNYVQ